MPIDNKLTSVTLDMCLKHKCSHIATANGPFALNKFQYNRSAVITE